MTRVTGTFSVSLPPETPGCLKLTKATHQTRHPRQDAKASRPLQRTEHDEGIIDR